MPNPLRAVPAYQGREERVMSLPLGELADLFFEFSTIVSRNWTKAEEVDASDAQWSPARPNEET